MGKKRKKNQNCASFMSKRKQRGREQEECRLKIRKSQTGKTRDGKKQAQIEFVLITSTGKMEKN